MKGWNHRARGASVVLTVIFVLAAALAWVRPLARSQSAPISPPTWNAPAVTPMEPPMAGGAGPAQLPPSPAPAPQPQPGQPTSPGVGMTAPPYYSPFPQPGAWGPPMVPAPRPETGTLTDPPAPMVTIHVRVPARVLPGEELTYRLLVENHSQARAHHVVVRDRLSAGARLVRANPEPSEQNPDLVWKLGTLQPLSTKEITLVVKPEGNKEVENRAYVQMEHGQTVLTQVSRPGLRLRVAAPPAAQLIHPIELKFELTNDGPGEARDVVLVSELPKGMSFLSAPSVAGENPLTWKIGTLKPGQTRSIPCEVSVPENAGDYTIRSEAAAAGGLREARRTTIKVGEAKLKLSMTGPASSRVDRSATYQLTVANLGTTPCPGVEIIDALYEGINFLQASGGGQLSGREVRWAVGPLAPGASHTVTCTIQAIGEGLFANVARASGEGGLSARARVDTRFSWLSVSLNPVRETLMVGQKATLVLQLANAGTRPATAVQVRVFLPEQLQASPLEASAGKVEGGQVTFADVPQIEPGSLKTFTLEVQIEKPGRATIRAEMMTAEMAGSKDARFAQPIRCEESVEISSRNPARITYRGQP